MKAGHDWVQVGLTRRRPGNGIEQKGGCQELGVGVGVLENHCKENKSSGQATKLFKPRVSH